MILHQGDRYVCNGTQVHPGSLNFLKSSLEIGVLYLTIEKICFFSSEWQKETISSIFASEMPYYDLCRKEEE